MATVAFFGDTPVLIKKKRCFVSCQSARGLEGSNWIRKQIIEPVLFEETLNVEANYADSINLDEAKHLEANYMFMSKAIGSDFFVVELPPASDARRRRFDDLLAINTRQSLNKYTIILHDKPHKIQPDTHTVLIDYSNVSDQGLLRNELATKVKGILRYLDVDDVAIEPPKLPVAEIANRIESVADTIAALRINSTTDVVEELRAISQLLKSQHVSGALQDIHSVNGIVKDSLSTLAGIFDAVENNKLAALIVAGGSAAIVGAVGGWPATACAALMLGAWLGKDAFMAALDKLPSSRAKTPEKPKLSRPPRKKP